MSRRRLGLIAACIALAVVFAPSKAAPPTEPQAVKADLTAAVLAPTHDVADTVGNRLPTRASMLLVLGLLGLIVTTAQPAPPPARFLRTGGSPRGSHWRWAPDLGGRSPPR